MPGIALDAFEGAFHGMEGTFQHLRKTSITEQQAAGDPVASIILPGLCQYPPDLDRIGISTPCEIVPAAVQHAVEPGHEDVILSRNQEAAGRVARRLENSASRASSCATGTGLLNR